MTTLSNELHMAFDYPKAPRWINTEAGNWAWERFVSWRGKANAALSVYERRRLLEEAEELRGIEPEYEAA